MALSAQDSNYDPEGQQTRGLECERMADCPLQVRTPAAPILGVAVDPVGADLQP